MDASAAWFRVLVEHAPDPMLIVETDSRVRYATPALGRVFGHAALDVLHTPLSDLLHPDDAARLLAACERGESSKLGQHAFAYRLRHADGAWRQVEIDLVDLRSDTAINGLLLTVRDVSNRRLADEALVHRALHDPLTGLPNRALLMDRLGHALARAVRQRRRVAVLFLDLDNFKVINDSLGHEAGDLLLAEVGHRLLDAVRGGDTVARFGGDEFAVLLEDVVNAEQAEASAERIAAALRTPLELFGRELTISVSIGIAVSQRTSNEPEDMLREADLAMYHAKAGGKGCYSVFQPAMQARADARLELETSLRLALRRGELRVHYQPIVTLAKGDVTGFEALVRWERPGHGLIPPAEFIPIAEETGLIVPLGQWVLDEACAQLQRWQQRAPKGKRLSVAVNMSARQLQDPRLVANVSRTLRESGVDPSCVTLEITESVLVDDAEGTADVLHQLKALGVQLAIDDFGTGYSSLSYLKRLPVDMLKIDRSFIKGLGINGQDHAIVRGILDLAGTLELTTTAEGIETDLQLSTIKGLGGQSGQGFLFARPLAADQVDDILADWSAAA
jgi:diguanylate cyclase (GGDEF)-like protein/PAS domain S-box-containing protein